MGYGKVEGTGEPLKDFSLIVFRSGHPVLLFWPMVLVWEVTVKGTVLREQRLVWRVFGEKGVMAVA
jgi:hypothetical protein